MSWNQKIIPKYKSVDLKPKKIKSTNLSINTVDEITYNNWARKILNKFRRIDVFANFKPNIKTQFHIFNEGRR